jgi:competence protein ComEC
MRCSIFLRLLPSLVAGIFCADRCFFHRLTNSPTAAWAFCGCLILLFATYGLRHRALRWLFGALLMATCFAGGWWRMATALEHTFCHLPDTVETYRVTLADAPELRKTSVRLTVRLEPSQKEALLYVSRTPEAMRLLTGDVLQIKTQLEPTATAALTDFYARRLARSGIVATGYVGKSWQIVGHNRPHTLAERAIGCREQVHRLYRRVGLTGDNLAVLGALTLGCKKDIDRDMRTAYSVAGASHVLALSGLHIGLLAGLLLFALRILPETSFLVRTLKMMVVLAALWGFAMLTGMSASVVRSATMFSLMIVAKWLSRRAVTMNTLLVTATVMLLCKPVWLFDIGFQLSFAAVAGILLLQRPLYNMMPAWGRVGKWVNGLISVSIAAQIATAPLVIHYFGNFPTHFLLTNLLVIPLVTLIMYVAVAMLLATPFATLQQLLAEVVNWLVTALNASVRMVERLPFASIDGLTLDGWGTVGVYMALATLGYWLILGFRRRHQRLEAGQ